eukprot:UN22807
MTYKKKEYERQQKLEREKHNNGKPMNKEDLDLFFPDVLLPDINEPEHKLPYQHHQDPSQHSTNNFPTNQKLYLSSTQHLNLPKRSLHSSRVTSVTNPSSHSVPNVHSNSQQTTSRLAPTYSAPQLNNSFYDTHYTNPHQGKKKRTGRIKVLVNPPPPVNMSLEQQNHFNKTTTIRTPQQMNDPTTNNNRHHPD